MSATPKTHIAHHTNDAIYVRDTNLVDDLIGKVTFTEMMFFQITGKRPTSAQVALLDAALVTLMEHGLTPSVIATRMVYISAPEAMQSAVAAGLLAVGRTFVGTMELAIKLIEEVLSAPEGEAARAQAIAQRHRANKLVLPGFGHHLHKPDDPRSARLLSLAAEHGTPGHHVRALRTLSAAIDSVYGRHITINATGAVAALLGEIGFPQEVMRGVAVVSRAAGLVGHILEESREPAARHMWESLEHTVPYSPANPSS
ncbi:MAG: citryl-CoA lyase [Betaproteobacteria bacterium]|nr:citryl-CoA lyase [Betaproteobacteria bacterium]